MLPPLHALARAPGAGGDRRPGDESPGWSTVNPNAGAGGPASWDGTSAAAHQLVGLSQEAAPARPSLQHERPVALSMQPPPPPRGRGAPGAQLPMCEALDLDDLQSFLSWDMYGIMEMGGGVSNEDMDDSVSQSWTGAI